MFPVISYQSYPHVDQRLKACGSVMGCFYIVQFSQLLDTYLIEVFILIISYNEKFFVKTAYKFVFINTFLSHFSTWLLIGWKGFGEIPFWMFKSLSDQLHTSRVLFVLRALEYLSSLFSEKFQDFLTLPPAGIVNT